MFSPWLFLLTVAIIGPSFVDTSPTIIPRHPRKYIDSLTLLGSDLATITKSHVSSGNHSYAPYSVLCPSGSLIRQAREVSSRGPFSAVIYPDFSRLYTNNYQICTEEQIYLQERNKITQLALQDLLSKNRIPNFDQHAFFRNNSRPIQIAITLSGGGYRAMLTGAGMLSAFDNRTPSSSPTTGLGGLLQATSYLGGISGGSWLVMSNYVNDFQPIHKLKDDRRTWNFGRQLLEGVPSFDPNNIPIKQKGQKSPDPVPEPPKVGLFTTIMNYFGFGKPEEKKVKKESFNIFTLFRNCRNSTSENVFGYSSLTDIFRFYKELSIEVRPKKAAGFHLSFTDYWGRALARRIFGITARTPGLTVTSCTQLESFRAHQQPFPIIGTIEATPGIFEDSKNSHLFEITPYEFGSWDPYLEAFVPVKYLGSSLYGGYSDQQAKHSNFSVCIAGFDTISFLTATSSSLFNHIFAYIYQMVFGLNEELAAAIATILKSFGLADFKSVQKHLHPEYAIFAPNPFYGYNPSNGSISSRKHMYLVDGGDDGQNILFSSFLTPARNVDLVLAYDITADYENYPNGTTIYNSAKRYHSNDSIGQTKFDMLANSSKIPKSVFPYVPTREQMVNEGLNKRPMFLGCDINKDYPILSAPINSTNSTNSANSASSTEAISPIPNTFNPPLHNLNTWMPPLIVYTPNADYGYSSNRSTFQLSYTPEEVSGMLLNGYNMATSMNSSYFSVCLNCAILKRSFDRMEAVIPKTCQRCFDQYCWSN